jgi:uncharacterized protein
MNTTTKKNKPLRRCLVTGESLPKTELLRIVRTPEGQLEIDLTGKANGRGAYLKKDVTLISRLIKNRLLEKTLKVTVTEGFVERLTKILNE